MTEQQIKQLKTLLEASQAQDNSEELDRRVLAAAQSKTEMRALQATSEPRRNLLPGLGTAGTAALSVLVTIAVFLGMSRVLDVEQSPVPLAERSSDLKVESTVVDGVAGLPMQKTIVRPPAPLQYPGMSKDARDRMLVDLELPSTIDLLDSMEFSLTRDRSFAASAIDEALADINSMIGSGELDDARKRYERLRRWCDVCQLPDTLEALALARIEPNTRKRGRG